MPQINLLPWREERRAERKKEFLVALLLVALLAAFALIVVDQVINGEINYQNRRNTYLQQNIAELDAEVAEIRDLQRKRTELLDRMRVIQELQGNRPVIVRIMDQLVRTVPDGVFYTSLKSGEGKNNRGRRGRIKQPACRA